MTERKRPAKDWRQESTGHVTWYTHSETEIRLSILELYGSVPATARFTTRPKDGPVFVVRKYLPESEEPTPINTVQTESEALDLVYETMTAVTQKTK